MSSHIKKQEKKDILDVILQRINYYCNKNNVSEHELLEYLGKPNTSLLRFVKRNHRFNVYHLFQIANYLGCLPEELVDDKDYEIPISERVVRLLANCSEQEQHDLLEAMETVSNIFRKNKENNM